jgi:monofunctional glycosyltransferase
VKRSSKTRGVGRAVGRSVIGAAACGFAFLIYVGLTLPDVRPLRASNPATTAFMQLRAQEARDAGRPVRAVQQWAKYGRISPHLVRAVLVAEDDAFWQHEGVDFEQLQESLEVDWARGRLLRGGSTITQQLAKNLYLSPSKNPVRKLREFLIARRLEAELPKSRILELYLNVIEWGDGIYGAEAAARTYFHTGAAALGPAQAAQLAAAIVNPRTMNPAHPTARLLRRQQLILRRMGSVVPPAEDSPPPPAGPATVPPSDDGAAPPAEVPAAPGSEAPLEAPTEPPVELK